MNKKITLLILIISPWIFAQDNSFEVKVDQVIGKNTEFWKAAGSDHLFYHSLKPSGQFLLKRMGEKGSHRYLRSHHTFNQDLKHGVIRGQNVYSEDKDGNPVYDFSNLNLLIKTLKIKNFFENKNIYKAMKELFKKPIKLKNFQHLAFLFLQKRFLDKIQKK